MRLSIVTVLCRRCGRVLSETIPRRRTDAEWDATPEDDREIDQAPKGCSPAFASWAECPDHPAPPPDRGLSYSKAALPLLWTVRVAHVPDDPAPEPLS